MSASRCSDSLPQDQALPPGTRLEEFVIEKVLGSGGFGITYLARDSQLGRQVVIKENLPAQFCFRDSASLAVRPRHSQGEDAENFAYSLASFEQEAMTLASLDHPGIVKVLRRFEAFGTAHFVMPFVEGAALDDLLKQGKHFGQQELQVLLQKLLAALGYLHERGIYHRDIKPGNILISAATGEPVLIDFGAARQRLGEKSLTVIESAGYTPFEQLQTRGKVGPWSDIYALAATFYKVLTGETPAKAADRVLEDPLVSLSQRAELRGLYLEAMLSGVDRALAPRASERFQDSAEWIRWMKADSARPAAAVPPPLPVEQPVVKPPPVPYVKPATKTSSMSKIKTVIGACTSLYALVLLAMILQKPSSITVTTPAPAPAAKPDSLLDQGAAGEVVEGMLPGGIYMKFVFCPPGSFLMGSPRSEEGRDSDEEQVQVQISQGFWLAQTEVTQRQWAAVMGSKPSDFKGDDLPVEQVSWEDAQAFITKLNQTLAMPAGWQYALPTEAQWEYACRAGEKGPYSGGSLDEVGWYIGNSGSKTHDVGQKKPNAWGLHDMHGNVWEWCSDWYDGRLRDGVDPTGPTLGVLRVCRGGSWINVAARCRAAYRGDGPGQRYDYLGFRPALVPSK